MKNLSTKIGGAILTFAFIFGISAAAEVTAQAQYRDRDAQRRDNRRYNNDRIRTQSQIRDWQREREYRERLERARRDNRNYGNYDNNGNYGNNGAYGTYGNYGNQAATNQGYQNGLSTGASDAQRGQSYNPQRSHFWRDASSQAFRSGFEQGYAQGFQQYGGGYGNGGYGNTRSRSGSILGAIFGRP